VKIGIIGMGMVGSAVAFGLKRINHEVVEYDLDPTRSKNSFFDILDTELVFVCVPTPLNKYCTCDVSAVVSTVKMLARNYTGLVVIKSTVIPGTCDRFAAEYPQLRIAFCPEFLRERARFFDFYENMELCIVGVGPEPDAYFDWNVAHNGLTNAALIKAAHGTIPKHFVIMTRTEAELAKYFVNCFNAYRINFANAFADVCSAVGADYNKVKDAVMHRQDTKSAYMDSNPSFRAFGGACLPKDTEAFASFVDGMGILTGLFETIVLENNRVAAGVIMQEKE
jgi:UDPglucose 6-dehydrogenase